MPVRLACVKHAASVRSEPGSNSQVHPARHAQSLGPQRDPGQTHDQPNKQTPDPAKPDRPSRPRGERTRPKNRQNKTVNASKNTSAEHSDSSHSPTQQTRSQKPDPQTPSDQISRNNPNRHARPAKPAQQRTRSADQHHRSAANISLPSLCKCQ